MYILHWVYPSIHRWSLGMFSLHLSFSSLVYRVEKLDISQEKSEVELTAADVGQRSMLRIISNLRSKFQCLKKVRFLPLFFSLL